MELYLCVGGCCLWVGPELREAERVRRPTMLLVSSDEKTPHLPCGFAHATPLLIRGGRR